MQPGGGELFIREGDNFRPLLWQFWTTEFPKVMKDQPDKYKDDTYVWVDANRDGLVQESEIQGPVGPSWMRGFTGIDTDLNLWHASPQNPVRAA